ncbi:anhydro-N-acetylmuramic acid kinase [Puia sp. P3]|uniref:anhydro-N-acetylmuramic acid kinase n=1 Tax=Puia sp. P3 TaxID=3423952 RepID=UPI003D675E8F
MVYKVIGLMSGSSLDGLDIVYAHLQEKASTTKGPKGWEYTLVHTVCYPYSDEWRQRLALAPGLSALEYQLLHADYGRYLGEQVLKFVEEFGLHFRVQLLVSHGHTAFHLPARHMTAQLGDGAAIAAVTGINVVSDLRSMDVALGGQGAPIVPIGELLLLPGYDFYLNLGGIANISRHGEKFIAFDVCPANRVLNTLVAGLCKAYDADGAIAATGKIDEALLDRLNELPYYAQPSAQIPRQRVRHGDRPAADTGAFDRGRAPHLYRPYRAANSRRRQVVRGGDAGPDPRHGRRSAQ